MVDFVLLFCIKYLYVFITVNTLENLWYPGSNGYGIVFDPEREILAGAVFAVMSLLILSVRRDNGFINTALITLYVLYYIPMNSAFAIHSMGIDFFIYSHLFVLFILFPYLCRVRIRSRSRYRLAEPEQSEQGKFSAEKYLNKRIVHIFCIAVCIFYIFYKISYNGLTFSLSIDGSDVYAVRDDYVESTLAVSGTLVGYALALVKSLAGIVVPVYLYIGLTRKSVPAICLSLFTVLCMFSVSSGKSNLFFIIITIGIFLLEKYGLIYCFRRVFLVGMVVLFLLSWLEIALFGESQLYIVVLRREMFTPSWLNTMYFEYFVNQPKFWWSESAILLQRIIPSVYSSSPLDIISNEYFAGTMPSPNTGLMAEAVMQAGVLGIIIYPVLYRIFFSVCSKVLMKYGEGFAVLLAAKIIISMTNVPILRTDFVLSYVLIVVVLAILPRLAYGHTRRQRDRYGEKEKSGGKQYEQNIWRDRRMSGL